MSERAWPWQGGAAIAPFPVPAGTPMAGYMARTGPSTGVHDGLTIAALSLRAKNGRLVILAVDLAGVDAELVDEIARAAGLARSEIVLCASHTHSGPAGVIARLHPAGADQSNPALRANFVTIAVATIAAANRRLEPVELVFGAIATHGLATNRNDPSGPFDPRVSVLATRRATGGFSAVLTHFACHPTILGAANRRVSADFAGVLRRSLSAALAYEGRVPIVMYANGSAGDVSSRFTRRSQGYAEVERVGERLAAAAFEALGSARPLVDSISFDHLRVPMPPRNLADLSGDISANAAPANTNQGDSVAERRRIETRAQGAALLAKLATAGEQAIPASLTLDGWKLGDLALIAVPGELFASLGAQIAGDASTLVLGYANGYAGYLVDCAAEQAGTYEALASPFAPGAGERVAVAAVILVERLRNGPDHD